MWCGWVRRFTGEMMGRDVGTDTQADLSCVCPLVASSVVGLGWFFNARVQEGLTLGFDSQFSEQLLHCIESQGALGWKGP